MVFTIVVSVIGAFIAWFVVGVVTQAIHKDVLDHLGTFDFFLALCLLFVSIYLVFLVGPRLAEIARIRATDSGYLRLEFVEDLDWFDGLGLASTLVVIIVYLFGISAVVKRLIGSTRGRYLFFWTLGILVFAGWMFVIHVLILWSS